MCKRIWLIISAFLLLAGCNKDVEEEIIFKKSKGILKLNKILSNNMETISRKLEKSITRIILKNEIKPEKGNNEENKNESTQRKKIVKYLLDNYPDFKDKYPINTSGLALEVTDFLYSSLEKPERRKKKESIRQELMQIKNGKIPFNK